MLRVAAVLAAAFMTYACFTKPDAPSGQLVGDGGHGTDAKIDDAPGSGSGSGSGNGSNMGSCPQDTFDTGSGTGVCGTWGAAFGSGAQIARSNMELRIQPSGSTDAGCISNQFDFSNGTLVQVAGLLAGSQGSASYGTFYEAQATDGTGQYFRVSFQNISGAQTYLTNCMGTVASSTSPMQFAPAMQGYWKFEHVGALVTTYAGSSPSTLLQIGTCTWTNGPATIRVRMGTTATSTATTPARFDNFNLGICQ